MEEEKKRGKMKVFQVVVQRDTPIHHGRSQGPPPIRSRSFSTRGRLQKSGLGFGDYEGTRVTAPAMSTDSSLRGDRRGGKQDIISLLGARPCPGLLVHSHFTFPGLLLQGCLRETNNSQTLPARKWPGGNSPPILSWPRACDFLLLSGAQDRT